MSPIETRAELRDGITVLHVEGYLSADVHEAVEKAYAEAGGDGGRKSSSPSARVTSSTAPESAS